LLYFITTELSDLSPTLSRMGKKHNDQEENGTYDTLLLKETHVHLGKKPILRDTVQNNV
jgi:hypothetical protein